MRDRERKRKIDTGLSINNSYTHKDCQVGKGWWQTHRMEIIIIPRHPHSGIISETEIRAEERPC